ncbi:uncharacterized protein EI90DRAFT_3014428 [Cantharellus anzutake]|uniref:uncharacterized protein n=1 Tax=Cantharellus anzutake TaxID=1750568 RepID=UPI00190754F5|nr:uncharacterized protein EI90DRAFT_3014428 [Cantharellus anzutake]KAF8335806.1 hypothetical protein EI90DRAFT_3014428 [Cantharellus anzutake]
MIRSRMTKPELERSVLEKVWPRGTAAKAGTRLKGVLDLLCTPSLRLSAGGWVLVFFPACWVREKEWVTELRHCEDQALRIGPWSRGIPSLWKYVTKGEKRPWDQGTARPFSRSSAPGNGIVSGKAAKVNEASLEKQKPHAQVGLMGRQPANVRLSGFKGLIPILRDY